jgi:hypothetical protein
MLYHDKETVSIAEVVRYIVTYDSALDSSAKHHLFPHITSDDGDARRPHKVFIRVRNTASMLLRPAFLQGPYILSVAVREDDFCSHYCDTEEPLTAPIYDQEVKASTSFWAELPGDGKYSPDRVFG